MGLALAEGITLKGQESLPSRLCQKAGLINVVHAVDGARNFNGEALTDAEMGAAADAV